MHKSIYVYIKLASRYTIHKIHVIHTFKTYIHNTYTSIHSFIHSFNVYIKQFRALRLHTIHIYIQNKHTIIHTNTFMYVTRCRYKHAHALTRPCKHT